MQQVVTITSQGQLTIPKKIREKLGIKSQTKAVLEIKNGQLFVAPKKDFFSLAGSLSSDVKLSDAELRKARASFQADWVQHEN